MEKRKIAVFIASPGDLANERRYFRETIDQLNDGFGDGAGVEFEPLGWEDTLATTGRRSQAVINQEVDRCDVFILTLFRRWGQEAPDSDYSSYTEEEFHRAFERWKKEKSPEIFVFFKKVDSDSEADPGPQLKKVMAFRRQLEETRQVLYHYFYDKETFVKEVNRHLRAYSKGDLPKPEDQRETVILPSSVLEEVEKAKQVAKEKIKEAQKAKDEKEVALLKLEAKQLEMAEDAVKLSKEGKIEFARQKFSELIVESSDLRILSLGFEFYYRVGDLETSYRVLEKWLTISGPEEQSVNTAIAFANLGKLFRIQGDLEMAEELYKKALEISKFLGDEEGVAAQFGSLGALYQTKGDLIKAEKMQEKALKISESLGDKVGMAVTYGNLGILYQIRGDLDDAEETYRRALELNKSFKNKEGIAIQYGSLGMLFRIKGELEEAEKFLKKALKLNKSLGSKEGMASQYNNLGNVYMDLDQGNSKKAEKMYRKALELNKSLGNKEGIAAQYSNLGNVFWERGDLQETEKMYVKSLELYEVIGSKEGLGTQLGNLGLLYHFVGELQKAKEFYNKSINLLKELGSPKAATVSEWLKELGSGKKDED
ncbi:MAG: DUF4062 domain-containing protein [Balneola sp.]|nr:MAG: DUF4062 domain-containing protein [Balneola sp.]